MGCTQYLNEGNWLGYTYYTPEVMVTISRTDGSPYNLVMEVDSGAAITLLPHGAAAVLGLVAESGTPVNLGGVGGSNFTCYVHIVNITVGETQVNGLPVAFAPTDDFPPLLGRLGLYDIWDILMDNTTHSTCVGELGTPISPPSSVWPPSGIDPALMWLMVGAGLLTMMMVFR